MKNSKIFFWLSPEMGLVGVLCIAKWEYYIKKIALKDKYVIFSFIVL